MTDQHQAATGPLAGIRVIDVTSIVLGPYATQMLGDLGADVIKVESPRGDDTRWIGPSREPGMASYFANLSRNKRSVVLDLKRTAPREALRRLIGRADVFVHNMRPGVAQRLGLNYAPMWQSCSRGWSMPAPAAFDPAAAKRKRLPSTISSRASAASQR